MRFNLENPKTIKIEMNPEILKISEGIDEQVLSHVSLLLKDGATIAYPTETVYGLGCDATNSESIEKISRLKGRSSDKPFLILIENKESVIKIVDKIPSKAEIVIDKLWPGPITLIFNTSVVFSPHISMNNKIAIRASSDPICQTILRIFKKPLVSTSANPQGTKPATTAQEVYEYFGKEIDFIIDGGSRRSSKVSTILDVTVDPPLIVRKGLIKKESIVELVGEVDEL